MVTPPGDTSTAPGAGVWVSVLVAVVVVGVSVGWPPSPPDEQPAIAKVVEAGEYGTRYPLVGRKEPDAIIKAYNNMLARLQQEHFRLGEQRGFAEKFIQESPVGILIFDYDGKITLANPRGCEFLGRAEAADLIGRDLASLGTRLAATLAELSPVPESHCTENAACVENAACYGATPAEAAKKAVALIQWISGAYLYSCSGGLLADTVSTSQIPYFLTANHCISKRNEAQNAECFFQYQTACGVTACPSPSGFARTLGATIKSTGRNADYTLLQLHQTPPAGSVFLG